MDQPSSGTRSLLQAARKACSSFDKPLDIAWGSRLPHFCRTAVHPGDTVRVHKNHTLGTHPYQVSGVVTLDARGGLCVGPIVFCNKNRDPSPLVTRIELLARGSQEQTPVEPRV